MITECHADIQQSHKISVFIDLLIGTLSGSCGTFRVLSEAIVRMASPNQSEIVLAWFGFAVHTF